MDFQAGGPRLPQEGAGQRSGSKMWGRASRAALWRGSQTSLGVGAEGADVSLPVWTGLLGLGWPVGQLGGALSLQEALRDWPGAKTS